MEKKYFIGLAIGILLLIGLLYTNTGAVVSVRGQSTIKSVPDIVSVNINIRVKNETVRVAKDRHDLIFDNLLTSLIILGIDRNKIKTQSFNVYQENNWENGKRIKGDFVVNHMIVVELENFENIIDVVDLSIDSGALVFGINFELSKEKQEKYKSIALEKASVDAKKKAEVIAKGLGKSIGSLIEIKTEDFNYGPYRYFEAENSVSSVMDAESINRVKKAALNLEPKELDISASVSVKYKLGLF